MSNSYEYVALQEIVHDGVRAYHIGDFVPAENVALHGYTSEQVAPRDSSPAVVESGTGADDKAAAEGAAAEAAKAAKPAAGAKKPTT